MSTKDNELFGDLIKQASAMLQDRSKAEADLIYYIAKMDSESRAAIILAYQFLYNEKDPITNDRVDLN